MREKCTDLEPTAGFGGVETRQPRERKMLSRYGRIWKGNLGRFDIEITPKGIDNLLSDLKEYLEHASDDPQISTDDLSAILAEHRDMIVAYAQPAPEEDRRE